MVALVGAGNSSNEGETKYNSVVQYSNTNDSHDKGRIAHFFVCNAVYRKYLET